MLYENFCSSFLFILNSLLETLGEENINQLPLVAGLQVYPIDFSGSMMPGI